MKILACHNYYQQRGGEDQLFEDDAKLLESRGHDVIWHTIHSDSVKNQSLLQVAMNTLWNRKSFAELTGKIKTHAPDIVHVVNTFPLFSPSIFHAARRANVPLVATIQNYRFFCAQAMCFRDGKACEECLGRIPWRSVRHACYRGSRCGSAVVAAMQMIHRFKRTWTDHIDVICVASEFSKSKLISAGLSEDQMIIKPNFVPNDPGKQNGDGRYAVFVGRLAGEKGITTLVDAWQRLADADSSIPLKIIGDGPSKRSVEQLQNKNGHIEWLGRIPNEDVYRWLGNAACLIFPSTGYESLPKTLIESMAVGTPVIGSSIGSVPEIVFENETGHLFPVADSKALAETVQKFFDNASGWPAMRSRCREQFEQRFMQETNYRALIAMYEEAIRRRNNATAAGSSLKQSEAPALVNSIDRQQKASSIPS